MDSRVARNALSALVCATLLGSGLSPASAAGDGADTAPPLVGGFALGDGLEATIDDASGALQLTLSAGSESIRWDSRLLGTDRHGLGAAWAFSPGFIDTEGGVRVFPASGDSYPRDDAEPTGLAGYPTDDVRFDAEAAALPARADGVDRAAAVGRAPEALPLAAHEYVLRELGGRTTWYDANGDPVASSTALGERFDWVWEPGSRHRLLATISPDGVVTRFDWRRGGDLDVTMAANLPGAADRVWRLEVGEAGLESITDPLDARIEIEADASGLVTGLTGPSGAETTITWAPSLDGTPRIRRVATADESGELSARTWELHGEVTPTAWPMAASDQPLGAAATAEWTTLISDGATVVESEYAQGVLTRRTLRVSTAGGEQVLREYAYDYERDARGRLAGAPRPTWIAVAFLDGSGGRRDIAEAYEFDAAGRTTAHLASDGTRSETTYDPDPAPGSELSIGLPVLERIETADGLVQEIRYAFAPSRAAVAAVERWSGSATGALTRVDRTEYDVRADGFVTERREFGGADDTAERTARWSDATDRATGTLTVAETLAVGTSAETTTTRQLSLVHGGVIAETDPLGRTALTVYDAVGRVVAQTDGAGRTTTTRHLTAQRDGRNATVVTDPAGVEQTELRDAIGRTTRLSDNLRDGTPTPGHERVSETRDHSVAGTVAVTDAWGAETVTSQDVFGRTVRTAAPNGVVHVTAYDDVAGSVTSGISATGRLADAETTSTEAFDADTRTATTSTTRADGSEPSIVRRTHDGLGRQISVSDGSTTSTTAFDAAGNPVTSRDTFERAGAAPASMTATRAFDAYGTSLEKLVSDEGGAHSGGRRTLDALGRTVVETDQLERDTTFAYTPDGLPERVVSPDGHVTTSRYHPVTRLLVEEVSTAPAGESITTAYEHDRATGRVTAVFDPERRAETEIRYDHDGFGNLRSTVYPDGMTVRNVYDEHGRRTATADAAGVTTEYEYDAAGLLARADQFRLDDRGERESLASVGYTYDALGRVSRIDRGNDVVTEYGFTSVGRIASETTSRTGSTVSERTYSYDRSGRLSRRTDRVADEVGALMASTTEYGYDGFGRLISSEFSGQDGEREATTYTPNAAGDLTATTVTTGSAADATTTDRRFEYSPTGELLAVTTGDERRTQEYDSSGRLVRSVDGSELIYDALGRPVHERTADGIDLRTEYWADGRRKQVSTLDASGAERSIRFYWDGDELVNDAHRVGGAGERVASYLIAAGRHSRTVDGDQGSTAYLGTDRHGNVTELTDQRGTVTARHAYTDYGAPRADAPPASCSTRVGDATVNPFGFAGEYTDCTGRQHLAVRSYDLATMRFTTPDDADTRNDFAFADLDPIGMVDPSGRTPVWDEALSWVFAGLALVTAAASIASAVITGGVSLGLFGVLSTMIGLAADSATLLAAGLVLAERYLPDIVWSAAQRENLMWAETALGLGAAIGFGLAWKAGSVLATARPSPKTVTDVLEIGDFPSGVSPKAMKDKTVSWGSNEPTKIRVRRAKEAVYRFDTRSHTVVFEQGFHPRTWEGAGMLHSYARGVHKQTIFVSTTTDPSLTGFPGNRYLILNAPGRLDLVRDGEWLVPYPREAEITFPGGIHTRYIHSVRTPDGQVFLNPHYRPEREKYLSDGHTVWRNWGYARSRYNIVKNGAGSPAKFN